jgi:hypothetical protein
MKTFRTISTVFCASAAAIYGTCAHVTARVGNPKNIPGSISSDCVGSQPDSPNVAALPVGHWKEFCSHAIQRRARDRPVYVRGAADFSTAPFLVAALTTTLVGTFFTAALSRAEATFFAAIGLPFAASARLRAQRFFVAVAVQNHS